MTGGGWGVGGGTGVREWGSGVRSVVRDGG